MKKSNIVLILLLVLELLLVLGTWFLVSQIRSGAWGEWDEPEALKRLMTVAFGAAPLIAIPFLIIIFSLRRKGQ